VHQKRKHVSTPADNKSAKGPRRKDPVRVVGRVRDDDDYEEDNDEALMPKSRRVRHQSEAC